MTTYSQKKLDLDEEGSVVNDPIPEPPCEDQDIEVDENAHVCDDIFCEMKTVEKAVFVKTHVNESRSDPLKAKNQGCGKVGDAQPRSAGA